MKRIKKFMFLFVACMFIVPACLLFGGCQQTELQTPVSIVSIEKTDTIGLVDVYTIYFSDGTSSTFTVTNGKDGANGNNGNNGQNGINGADGQGLTIDDLYDAYKIENPDVTFADFLDYLFENYIDTADISTRNINKALNSCMKVYTVFYEESTSLYGMGGSRTTVDRVAYCGSAVVYAVYEDYAYIITNYHVVFDDDANLKLNGSKIAYEIKGYLYGSESDEDVKKETQKDEDGYTVYSFGGENVELEYVGGSIACDIAVLRANTENLKAINPNVSAVEIADGYHVGETVFAVGNSADYGMSATKGVVSVDNEYVSLAIDSQTREYRSIRFDAAIYGGNSGGGLFNSKGQLIGICNSGSTLYESMNNAIPYEIVKNSADSIIYYFNDGKSATNGVYKLDLGATFEASKAKYVYNAVTGFGEIEEEVYVKTLTGLGIMSNLGLEVDDRILQMTINGVTYNISRDFQLSDLCMSVRPNDVISFVYERAGEEFSTENYSVVTNFVEVE